MILLLKILILLTALFYYAVQSKHALHMFQQNRYELSRYGFWLRKEFVKEKKKIANLFIKEFLLVSIFFLALFFSINERALSIIYIVAMLIMIYLNALQEKQETYIQPLNVTARVKRQIWVMEIINSIYLIGVIVFVPIRYISIFIAIGNPLQWIIIYLMAFITKPIEKIVHWYFINDAKKTIRRYKNLKIIGITGSFGKTSSKHVLQEILGEKYYSLMTPASFNTPMGISITIREELKAIHEVFICEMGADKVGDIDFLCKFVKPQYGVLVAIGPQHLQTFHTMENIINEKFKIIEDLPANGVGFINYDNEYIRNYKIKNNCTIVTFGIDYEDVDFRGVDLIYSPNGTVFNVVLRDGRKFLFETKLLGKHNVSNILSAIAVGYHLGLSIESLQKAVSSVKYIEHRLQVKKENGITWIDNAFNSNPVGAKMSLEVMKMMPQTRYILTPGLIDLGDKQDEYNESFGEQMIHSVDEVYLIGESQTKPIMTGLIKSGFDMENVHVFNTIHEAFSYVKMRSVSGDTILLENDLPDAFNK